MIPVSNKRCYMVLHKWDIQHAIYDPQGHFWVVGKICTRCGKLKFKGKITLIADE